MIRLLSFLTLCIPLLFATASAQEKTDYRIEEVKGNVWRFTAGTYHSVFMVTDEGIFVADPISAEAGAWLKKELSARFKAPIRYVAYSHNHFDHTDGGQSLDGPGVTFISQKLAREDLVRTKADTKMPDLVFGDEAQIFLGDSSVRLKYHGTNNGRGSVSMKFEPAGVVFVVDWIVIGRMPYRDLQGYDIVGMMDSTRDVLAMDFDAIVCGHGDTGDRADVKRYLSYLERLYSSVVEGRRAGKDVEALKKEIRLDEFKDLKNHEEWLPLNVEGVSRILDDQSYFKMQEEAR